VVAAYRRVGYIKRMCQGLAAQSHPPAHVWITVFGSEVVEALRTEFDQFRAGYTGSTGFRFASGDMNLGYYGRIQLGLQAETPFTVFLDDDCIPGSAFMENAMKIMHTAEYRGLLGIKGHAADLELMELTYYGPLEKSNYIVEADVVGGAWIVETDWVRLAFRTKQFTWGTGEDYTWCANLRKYANVGCFVLPHDQKNPRTWGVSREYFEMSEAGDTTNYDKIQLRRELASHLWQRGAPFMHVTKEVWRAGNIVFGIREMAQVQQVVQFVSSHMPKEHHQGVYLAYIGRSNGEMVPQMLTAAASILSDRPESCCIKSALRAFDLGVGRDFSRKRRNVDTWSDVMLGMDQVLRATHPTALLLFSDGSPESAAAAVLASTLRVSALPLGGGTVPGSRDHEILQAAMGITTGSTTDDDITARSLLKLLA